MSLVISLVQLSITGSVSGKYKTDLSCLLSSPSTFPHQSCDAIMDPAAVEEFRKLEQEKNRLEGEIKTLYEYLTEDGFSVR